uniref:Putative secreted protein n=1 Tax=Anopheles darlingi TaxID=43151 RepID=A0A2M4DLQ7_ANODA
MCFMRAMLVLCKAVCLGAPALVLADPADLAHRDDDEQWLCSSADSVSTAVVSIIISMCSHRADRLRRW